MSFSESIKNQVKEKADFRCCRCKHVSFEVHHINPQKDDGPDTLDNAAPLCPNCHADFGDNPAKRKEITQMRDLWYRRVKEMYSNQMPNDIFRKIDSKLDALALNHEKGLEDLKETLLKSATESIRKMTMGTAQVTASGIANVIAEPYHPVKQIGISGLWDSVFKVEPIGRPKCPKCGTLRLSPKTKLFQMAFPDNHYRCETCGKEFAQCLSN